MDRRQRKSRDAIFRAFKSLLYHKRYSQITVQDIIDKADVSRSTFYAHFETKDLLLQAICNDIFDHIFAGEACDYPGQSPDLQSRLAHILWHLQEQRSDVLAVWDCDDLFLFYFKQQLRNLFSLYLEDFSQQVPADFLLHHLVGSFCEAVRWWIFNDMRTSPEALAANYMRCIR